jgi:ankyrin repeat protein
MSIVSPLYRALFDGDLKSIDRHLEGRNVNSRTQGDGWNLLHMVLMSVSEAPKPKVVKHLINLGVDVNARDRRRWTPLHFAARAKSPPVIQLLIDAGAQVNVENDEGITPMHESLLRMPWNLAVAEVFLAAGARTDTMRSFVDAVACPEKDGLLKLIAKYNRQP